MRKYGFHGTSHKYVAQTMVPTAISNLMGTIIGVFNPQITIAYAEGDKENLVKIIKSCNRILIFIMSIPIAFLTAYGEDFYALWQPTKDASALHRLSPISGHCPSPP